MRILFARHGESEANVQRIFVQIAGGSIRSPRGRTRAQVHVLARNLGHHRVSASFASPVGRAVESAPMYALVRADNR